MASNESYEHTGDPSPPKSDPGLDWTRAHRIILAPDVYDKFVDLLDEPAKPVPGLSELFERPSPFTQEER